MNDFDIGFVATVTAFVKAGLLVGVGLLVMSAWDWLCSRFRRS